jgi:hypothetical protein
MSGLVSVQALDRPAPWMTESTMITKEPTSANIAAATTPKATSQRRQATAGQPERTKGDIVLQKLQLARGVTVAQIVEATGWQSHSARAFLSAVVRKKLGLNLVSEVGKDGQRRYRVIDGDDGAGRNGRGGSNASGDGSGNSGGDDSDDGNGGSGTAD